MNHAKISQMTMKTASPMSTTRSMSKNYHSAAPDIAPGASGHSLDGHAPKLLRMPSVRLALAIFAGGTAVLAYLADRLYQSMVNYCEGSPEVAAGGDKLSCLEPQHWSANAAIFGFLALLEVALVVVVGAAVVHSRGRSRTA